MKKIDFEYLCTVIGNLAGIPVRVYKNGKQTFYHSLVSLPKDPVLPYVDDIMRVDSHIGYFITPMFDYFGIVNSKPYKIVIGPSRQSPMPDQELKELAFQCDVKADELPDFIAGMKSLVQMPLTSILQVLCTMNYVMNGEKLTLKDVTIYDVEQQEINKSLETLRANADYEPSVPESQSEQAVHNTFSIEQTIVNIVRKGDSSALRKWVSTAPAIREGTLASDQIRQMKNTFIVSTTLVSRAAIRGGMDVEDALRLSDSYIRKCELLFGVDSIMNLQYHMVLDYTERVEKLRNGTAPSRLVIDVSNYVQHHLSEPVDVEALAKAVYLSRTRLAVKFKEQTGMTLTEFILQEKINEAKRLIRYTDKPLSAISFYLGFSSQSHFANTFRKYAGCSPNEYRLKYNS